MPALFMTPLWHSRQHLFLQPPTLYLSPSHHHLYPSYHLSAPPLSPITTSPPPPLSPVTTSPSPPLSPVTTSPPPPLSPVTTSPPPLSILIIPRSAPLSPATSPTTTRQKINTQGIQSALERRHTNPTTKTRIAYGNSHLACNKYKVHKFHQSCILNNNKS